MRKTLIALLFITAGISIVGCKKKDNGPSNTGSVMFVNGCAGTLPAIDVKINNANVSGALNISFPASSGYKVVSTGTAVNIGFFLTNVGTPISSQSVTVESGVSYTAFCAGLITQPAFLFTKDDMTPPSANNSRIRFVNLSKDNLNVTASAQTTNIGTDVKSLEVTKFIEVPAGSYELKAGDPSDISTVVSTDPKAQTLGAGKIYTLMLTGSKGGTSVSALKLTLISNN